MFPYVYWYSFSHFYHMDHANAAMHCADVKFSPITLQLAAELEPLDDPKVNEVISHIGKYEPDPGR